MIRASWSPYLRRPNLNRMRRYNWVPEDSHRYDEPIPTLDLRPHMDAINEWANRLAIEYRGLRRPLLEPRSPESVYKTLPVIDPPQIDQPAAE